jgi:5-methylcytosine-specific restriction endonuclease McrA
MKRKKLNVKHLWIQFEDFLFPRLRLSITDRAVYSHLIRHSRLEGRLQLHFSMPWLARGIGISTGPVRESVRRLVVLGALRLIRRSKAGHVVDVLLPDEIRGLRPGSPGVAGATATLSRHSSLATRHCSTSPHLEELDFLKTRALRQSIHLRERGHCFYCLRRTDARVQCLDHVVPRARAGHNSYRNLVSSCLECNSLKGERPAAHFLRWLYRERRITSGELNTRLRALDALASGKLPPPVHHPDTPIGRKGRPPASSCGGAALLRPKAVIPSGARNPGWSLTLPRSL